MHTKIICTLGPATDDPGILRELIENGMNVARFNFSHGTHEEQLKRYKQLINLREELGVPVATLLDTKGPEIRLGLFENGGAHLKSGETFTLTTQDCLGTVERVSISYGDLPLDVETGGMILLDDGKIALRVESVTATDIICTVLNDGRVADKKGVNVPGAKLSMPFVSEKDYDDIIFAAREGFDFVAASFTRTADDIKEVRMLLNWNGGQKTKIIAKIENMQGVENIDKIIDISDGVMIARGDLGVEVPLEEVPVIQKDIIRKVAIQGKTVITATQMLESMMNYPRPTRAEATDVANSIYDGTTAIMLSGETAVGKYPIETLKTMARLAERTERDINYRKRFKESEFHCDDSITHAISNAACAAAMGLEAKAVVAFTLSGRTAQAISAFRSGTRIIACTTCERVFQQLAITWGVSPFMVTDHDTLDEMFEKGLQALVDAGMLEAGDIVVLTAGVPIGVSGSTNFIKVTRV